MENLIKIFEKVRDEATTKFLEEEIKFREGGGPHIYSFCSLWFFIDGRKKITKDIISACNEIDGISIINNRGPNRIGDSAGRDHQSRIIKFKLGQTIYGINKLNTFFTSLIYQKLMVGLSINRVQR